MSARAECLGRNRALFRRAAIPVGLFCFAYITHVLSGVIASGDSRWAVPTALSILHEGNTDIDEYPELIHHHDYYWLEEVNGHWYSRFPIGVTLLSVPFVFVLDQTASFVFAHFPGFREYVRAVSPVPLPEVTILSVYWRIELLIACGFIAAAAVFVYGMARCRLEQGHALLLALLFLFCTPAWSSGSRCLGQHVGSILVLSAAIYLLLAAERRPWIVQLSALPLAFAFVVRPTNAIPILLFSLYVLLRYRKYFLPYLGWAATIAIPFFLYNLLVYKALLSPYYLPQRQLGSTSHFYEALAGVLISPGRGLFVFSPLFLFSFWGFWISGRQPTRDWLGVLCGVAILLHWLMVASFGDWWGGHSFGPRYFSDITPLFIYLIVPVLAQFRAPWTPRAKAALAAFMLCAAISAFIHFRGANSLDTWAWNREPVNVNEAPERLWDWSDPQFLRGLW